MNPDELRYQGAVITAMIATAVGAHIGRPKRVDWKEQPPTYRVQFLYDEFKVDIIFRHGKPIVDAGVIDGKHPNPVTIANVEQEIGNAMNAMFGEVNSEIVGGGEDND